MFGNTRFRQRKILFLGTERKVLEATTSGKVNIVREIERIDVSGPYYDKGNNGGHDSIIIDDNKGVIKLIESSGDGFIRIWKMEDSLKNICKNKNL